MWNAFPKIYFQTEETTVNDGKPAGRAHPGDVLFDGKGHQTLVYFAINVWVAKIL